MTRTLFLILIATLTCLGAEDSWSKVRELKNGIEIRIFKKGASQPILAKADEATDDKLMAVVKNEQVAIPKSDIDRVDARPAQSSRRITKEARESNTDPNKEAISTAHPRMPDVPGSSSSTNYSIGGKPDFETIYRRTPGQK
ncbi:MAG: hypothetical protein M3Y27_18710 [Acidobacteriota bacterium]|nr:hypothetical protein [Acidobacteriota bacterium]